MVDASQETVEVLRKTPEAFSQSKLIFMLDVDGVVTNPETKRPHPRILAFIANCLFNDRPIALATTRDYAWLERYVISPIRPYLQSNKMDNLFISTEKAAVSVSFIRGHVHKEVDTSVVVPDELRKEVKDGLDEQNRTGIFNYPKEAVHTVEISGGNDSNETAKQQKELDEFNDWLQREIMPRFPDYKADRTAIAIDIFHRSGNKMLSAQRFVEHLRGQGVNLTKRRFLAIGDGLSDMEMAIGLRDEGLNSTFVWVGRGDPPKEPGIKTITSGTNAVNDKGTVDILAYFGEISAFGDPENPA